MNYLYLCARIQISSCYGTLRTLSSVLFFFRKTLRKRENHSPYPQWSHACVCPAASLQRSCSPCSPTHVGCFRLCGGTSQVYFVGCSAVCGVGAAFCRLSEACEAPSHVLSQALSDPPRLYHLHARQRVPLLPRLSISYCPPNPKNTSYLHKNTLCPL